MEFNTFLDLPAGFFPEVEHSPSLACFVVATKAHKALRVKLPQRGRADAPIAQGVIGAKRPCHGVVNHRLIRDFTQRQRIANAHNRPAHWVDVDGKEQPRPVFTFGIGAATQQPFPTRRLKAFAICPLGRQQIVRCWWHRGLRHENKQRVFLCPRQTALRHTLLVDHDGCHLHGGVGKFLLQQAAEVMNLVLVDGHDQHARSRVQQAFRKAQALGHEGQPLAVLPLVVFVNVIVVVLPIPRACVVGRVDIDAIYFALIREQQQLQCVVVVCLDQDVMRSRGVTVGDGIYWCERWVNRFAHAANDNQLLDWERLASARCCYCLDGLLKLTQRLTFFDRHHAPDF